MFIIIIIYSWLVYVVSSHFIISDIATVDFIGGEDHLPVVSHWQTLSHNVVSSTPRHERGSNSHL